MEKEQIISGDNNTNTSKQDINNIEKTNNLSELFDYFNFNFNRYNELDEDSIMPSELYFNKQEKNKDEYKSKPTIEKQSISNDSKDIKNKHLNIKRNRSKQKNNISNNDNFNENTNQIKNVIKSNLIDNSLPQKITNNEITKNKDEGNMLELKTKIFQALPKIFGLEKIDDNNFIKSLTLLFFILSLSLYFSTISVKSLFIKFISSDFDKRFFIDCLFDLLISLKFIKKESISANFNT